MRKKIVIIIFFTVLLFINTNIKAALVDRLDGFEIPAYCGNSACYTGPYNNHNTYKVATFAKENNSLSIAENAIYVIGDNYDKSKDVVAILCTNYMRTSPIGHNVGGCSKITNSTTTGYWNNAMKASVATILKATMDDQSWTPRSYIDNDSEETNEVANRYYTATKTITKLQADVGLPGVETVDENVNDTWLTAAKKMYNSINNMKIIIKSITYREDTEAFYLNVSVSKEGAGDYTITTSVPSTKQSDGTYKILKSDLSSGSNTITVTATLSYRTYIAENYYCGGYQSLTPMYIEEATVGEVDDTENITLSTKYRLDVNSMLDGVLNMDGLELDNELYGSYSMKVNGISNPAGFTGPSHEEFDTNPYDYWNSNILRGTTYELTNIMAAEGYEYLGYSIGTGTDTAQIAPINLSNSITGTVTANTSILLHFKTVRDFTIIKKNSRGDSILGAVAFNIYSDSNCSNHVKQVTTRNGQGIVSLQPGTYYIKEISAPDEYHVDNACEQIYVHKNPTGEQNKKTIINPTKCEAEFARDSSILNRIRMFKQETYANTFNNLLDFSITDPVQACSNYSPAYTNRNFCLVTEQNIESQKPFSSTNLSAFNDVVQKDAQNIGFCLTQFKVKNAVSMPSNTIKAGMLVIGSKNNNKALTGELTKTCYVYSDVSGNFRDSKTYDDYVDSIVLDNQTLKKDTSNERILMKYEKTEANGLKKYVSKVSVNYYFNDIYVYKISGRPNCTETGKCTFVGYGILSEFQDGKANKSSFDYKVNFKGVSNANSSSSLDIFTSASSVCEYNIEPEIIKYKEPQGKIDLEFRAIDTNIPFERQPKSNWNDGSTNNSNNELIQNYIINATNSYGMKNGEKQTPKYKITLTPDTVEQIRLYNKNQNNSYDNYLICLEGDNCYTENAFLHTYIKNGIIVVPQN